MTQAGRVWYVDLDPSPKDLKNPKTHKKDKKKTPAILRFCVGLN